MSYRANRENAQHKNNAVCRYHTDSKNINLSVCRFYKKCADSVLNYNTGTHHIQVR